MMAAALAVWAAAGLAASPQAVPPQEHRAFRSGIEVTSITATVRDADGKLVQGLDRDAFEVFEDGEPQTITQFTRDRVPVGLGVLLDISDSMFGRRIQDARTAIDRFLFELLGPGDEFFLLAFNHQPHLLTGWTSTPDPVRRALEGLRPSGGTAAMTRCWRRSRRSRGARGSAPRWCSSRTARHGEQRLPATYSLMRSDAFVHASPSTRRSPSRSTRA